MSEATRDTSPTVRPRAYIVTIYGLYGRKLGGWLSVSSLITLMQPLGVEEPAVRSSISRLKLRGIVEAERHDGVAGYTLSAQARTILARGDHRIYQPSPATVADGWVLAVFSIPESERTQRHQLRSKLGAMGFGTVAPGVWIAPSYLEEDTRATLEAEGLMKYVDLFRATYTGAALAQVPQWWDLSELSEGYRGFLENYQPVLDNWRRRRKRDDEAEAFGDLVRMMTAWRRLPYRDPGLPTELLPHPWVGDEARGVLWSLLNRLETPAARFAESTARPATAVTGRG